MDLLVFYLSNEVLYLRLDKIILSVHFLVIGFRKHLGFWASCLCLQESCKNRSCVASTIIPNNWSIGIM